MEYTKKLIPCHAKKTENIAVLMFFVTFIALGIVNLVDKRTPLLATGSVWFDSLIALGMFLVGLVLHEGLHALCAVCFGKIKPADVRFGIDLSNFNLYTHFRAPMTRKAYQISVITPCIVVVLIPLAFVTAFGSPILLAASCLLFAGSAGDIVIFFSVRKQDEKALILDHPTALAYYVVSAQEGEIAAEEAIEDETELLKKYGQESKKTTKKSLLFKCFGILAFIAVYVLAMYLISLVMQNI